MAVITGRIDPSLVGSPKDCPSLVELAAQQVQPDPDISRHVDACPRCRALLRALPAEEEREPASEQLDIPAVAVPERLAPPGELAAGELVTISSERSEGELLVALVIATSGQFLRVAPVIACADLGDDVEFDVHLSAQTPLGYEAVADLGCVGWVDVGQVEERFGAVAGEILASATSEAVQLAGAPAGSLEVLERRGDASSFFLPTLREMFEEAEASAPVLGTDLTSSGWAAQAVDDLRRGWIDRDRVSPELVAVLFRAAGWAGDSMLVERDTALRAVRLAIADQTAPSSSRSKAVAAMAFLAQVPGITKRRLSVDEFVAAVARELDKTDS
jgi:hypothetical protein